LPSRRDVDPSLVGTEPVDQVIADQRAVGEHPGVHLEVVLDDAVLGDMAGPPLGFRLDVGAIETPSALSELEALAVELVDPFVLSLGKARAKARDPAGGGHSQKPPLRSVKRAPGPPLVGDLARQEERVAPESAEDFQVPALRC
jgi:hypothetical protein